MGRRVGGFILVMAGFLLIFLGPLLKWYVQPRVEKAPNDVYDRKVAEGTGQYFIVTEGRLSEQTQVRNISIYKGDPDRSTSEVAVIENFSRTLDVTAGKDFDYSLETYAMDRVTGEAVHCCGEDPPKEGHTLKLPFHLEKTDYALYNDSVRQAFPAAFQGEEEVEGLNTYKFVSQVPESVIATLNVPGAFVGRPDDAAVSVDRYYTATTTIWVEPNTGAVIKRSQQSHQWLLDGETGSITDLAIIDVTDNEATVQETAEDVSSQVSQLKLVTMWVPLVGPILGILMVVAGIFLLREPAAAGGAGKPDSE